MKNIVSIVIPTYNRAHLLGPTLDSILVQTYKNWECIVVDDGSTDYTTELMDLYCEKDYRVQFHHRPKNRLKGANACRNYGFEISKGKYIQWFDSDDLMVPEFLEIKVGALDENKVDFVISKATNFRDPNPEDVISKNENYYRFDEFDITNFNYVTQRNNWLTYDFMGKREVVEKVRFNERLSSSQEYNFFCQLTCFTTNALIIDEYLTKRRIHSGSIRARFNNDPKKEEEYEDRQLETWNDISMIIPGSASERYLLYNFLKINKRTLPSFKAQRFVFRGFVEHKRFRPLFYMLLYKYIFYFTGKGLFLRKRFENSFSK